MEHNIVYLQIALQVYNLTIGQMCQFGAHQPGLGQPKGSVLLSHFKPVMLSVKQSVNRPDCVPDLVSVT